MIFTREQKKEAYKKLAPEAQDFVMSEETTEAIGNILNEVGLSEEQSIDADGEIFSSLLGLQTLSEAISNISKLSKKNVNELSELKEKLDEEIFSKIAEMDNSKETTSDTEDFREKVVSPPNKVGASFEQIILNQARAMQPARPANETGRSMNYESGIMVENKNIPENLPTENKPHDTHNYPKGEDPYREPLE